jgi:hypothetical protein
MLKVNRVLLMSAVLFLVSMGTAFAASEYEPGINVTDQLGSSFNAGYPVIINSVTSDGPGWIVIAEDYDGKPGDILGYAALSDGINRWVKVPVTSLVLDRTVKVHAFLLKDAGTVGVFEFPDKDLPEMSIGAGQSSGSGAIDKTFLLNPPGM